MVTVSGCRVGVEGTRAALVVERRSILLAMRFINCSSLSAFASEPSIADIQETIDCVIEL